MLSVWVQQVHTVGSTEFTPFIAGGGLGKTRHFFILLSVVIKVIFMNSYCECM